jgi:hypothetical protein
MAEDKPNPSLEEFAATLPPEQAAELKRIVATGGGLMRERWARDRKTVRQACRHDSVTWGGAVGEVTQCSDCGCRQVGSVWADPEDWTFTVRIYGEYR